MSERGGLYLFDLGSTRIPNIRHWLSNAVGANRMAAPPDTTSGRPGAMAEAAGRRANSIRFVAAGAHSASQTSSHTRKSAHISRFDEIGATNGGKEGCTRADRYDGQQRGD